MNSRATPVVFVHGFIGTASVGRMMPAPARLRAAT